MSRYNRCKECYNMKCVFVTGEREDIDTSECSDFSPMTNADRIRAMTDEELAEWIADILTFHNVKMFIECEKACPLYKCCNDQPSDNIEDWLKSPVEVDNG